MTTTQHKYCLQNQPTYKLLLISFTDLLSGFLGQFTPITSHYVETFQFLSFNEFVTNLCDADGSVFLLLQQQHCLEYAINIYLQQPVQLVHFIFNLIKCQNQRRFNNKVPNKNSRKGFLFRPGNRFLWPFVSICLDLLRRKLIIHSEKWHI